MSHQRIFNCVWRKYDMMLGRNLVAQKKTQFNRKRCIVVNDLARPCVISDDGTSDVEDIRPQTSQRADSSPKRSGKTCPEPGVRARSSLSGHRARPTCDRAR